ncbi:MAG TPA: hypothetical protein VII50_09790 [Acidothermaceae bacterium]
MFLPHQFIELRLEYAAASLFAILFLARYFRTRTLTPFAVYCLFAGGISIIRFAAF